MHQKILHWIPGQGLYLGFGFSPVSLVRHVQVASDQGISFSPSLSKTKRKNLTVLILELDKQKCLKNLFAGPNTKRGRW